MSGRLVSLVPVAAASALPLALVVGGLLESADLLLALAVEAALLAAFAGLQSGFSSTSGIGSLRSVSGNTVLQSKFDDLVGRFLLFAALACGGAAVVAGLRVTWDWSSAVGIALVLGYAFAGVWRHSWQAGSLLPHGARGVLWRLAVVAVGFALCLPAADALGPLAGAGWSPAPGTGPVGLLERLLLSDLLGPQAWPAALLLAFRGVNEVGFAALRLLGDPGDPDDALDAG